MPIAAGESEIAAIERDVALHRRQGSIERNIPGKLDDVAVLCATDGVS